QDVDGRYIIAGRSGGKFAVVRLLSNGTFDNEFDQDGKLTIDVSTATVDVVTGMHVADDGSILLCGTSGNSSVAIAKLNDDGSKDADFRGGGVFTDAIGSGKAMVSLPNGKFLVAGMRNGVVRVTRYRPNGDIDTTYGSAGSDTLSSYAIA